MKEAMRAGMLDATRLVREGGLLEATATIQRTLLGIVTAERGDSAANPAPPPNMKAPIEGDFRVLESDADLAAETAAASLAPDAQPFRFLRARRQAQWWPNEVKPRPHRAADVGPGRFITGTHTNHAGTRSYKLYIPTGDHGQSMPLIVMLHGCTQNPDDFAAGTRMNMLAEEHHCFVLYPMQAQAANGQKCWNWFRAIDQQRDRGEPSIIAAMTREIIATYPIDARRVYVAGLSAGGAMAAIMGTTYPDLYAAVGIHSGLPYAVAHDLPSALAAMKQGGATGGRKGGAHSRSATPQGQVIPTIVFHGDRDTTVHPSNGDHVVAQRTTGDNNPATDPHITLDRGQVPDGHAYTRAVHRDASGQTVLEQWRIHGAGHAWSGGSPNGSYTDPKGPDAAREMIRFFYEHPQREY